MAALQQWRKRQGLTQADAAALLGVSQPYMSLIEKGMRPLTPELRGRMKSTAAQETSDDFFRARLSALGYPGFAHIPRSRAKRRPGALLLAVLSNPDVDPRIVEALPWLVRRHASRMDFDWLVRHAKLRNLQNNLGFVLQASGVESPAVLSAVRELERARLLQEATLCWESMPGAVMQWMRANRTALAQHWNILTMYQAEDVQNAA